MVDPTSLARWTIHPQPPEVPRRRHVLVDGIELRPLEFAGQIADLLFQVSFEELVARLSLLPRMFVEPDGSLVWVGESGGQSWQLDGQVTDRQGHVAQIELCGLCPDVALDELLSALGWPEQTVAFSLVLQGLVLAEPDFRRWLASRAALDRE